MRSLLGETANLEELTILWPLGLVHVTTGGGAPLTEHRMDDVELATTVAESAVCTDGGTTREDQNHVT